VNATLITVEELLGLEQYAQVRDTHRAAAIAARRIRRVELGPFLSVAFESRELLTYQIHEVLHAEQASSAAALLAELGAYNALLPGPGFLSATLLIELTDDDTMRYWLGALVDIERHLVLSNPDGTVSRSVPERGHAAALTRTDATSAVHYLQLPVSGSRVEYGCTLGIDHPAFRVEVALTNHLVDELNSELGNPQR
jgi:hypothetical protein